MLRLKSAVKVSALIAGAALVMSACGGATTDPTANSGNKSDDGTLSVGVTIHQADVYFQGVADEVVSVVKSDGGKSKVVNTETNAATEATGIQNLISSQVDGLIISPLSEEGSLASIKAAKAAGIPIVCYNTCVGSDSKKYAAAFIESDQKDLGTQTGTFAAEQLKADNKTSVKLGMLNCNRYPACKSRQSGFLEALKAGGIKADVVADQEALAPDEASKKATDILTAHPDLDVFWGSSQGSTEGLVAAVNAAGKSGSIALYGTDVSTSLIESIKAGDLQAITGQDSKKTGALAMDYISRALKGEKISPFQVQIPGNLYAVGNAKALDKYLGSN